MFSQVDFGKRLKEFRKKKNFTQKEIATRIGVSEQAVSKWENGECLPDVYNLKLLGQLLHISVDTLLDTENDKPEKVIETIKIGGAEFGVIEKPETILAGKIIFSKDYEDINAFHNAIDSVTEGSKQTAFGYVREVTTEQQPKGIDVYKMPPSLYIRAYTDKATAQLIAKEECEVWELFAYIRDYFMPANGFRMADNGAQELEVFDSSEHKTGYAYMPVTR